MIDLLLSVSFFVVAIMAHAWFCRQQPQGVLYAKSFVIIALCMLAVQVYWMFHVQGSMVRFPLSAIVLYLLFIPTFLIVYISTVLMSPSKRILQALSKAQALTQEQLLLAFNGDEFIDLRLEELLASHCIVKQEGRYQLTFHGELMYHGLMAYQKLCGRRGEG